MDAADQDIDDDTHICLKCRTTIVGTFHRVKAAPGHKLILTELLKISLLGVFACTGLHSVQLNSIFLLTCFFPKTCPRIRLPPTPWFPTWSVLFSGHAVSSCLFSWPYNDAVIMDTAWCRMIG
jgi:hypothetical protein